MAEDSRKVTIEKSEIEANIFTAKCQITMTLVMLFALILNILDIFIIEDSLMYKAFFGSLLCTILACIVVKFYNTSPITKYIILFIMVALVTIVGIFLTYHLIIISALPILCSAQYKNKRFIYYSYGITVISTFLIVMLGYFYGLCDANMYALTNTIGSEYVESGTGKLLFDKVNENPWGTLPLYYAFPRCLVLYCTIPMIKHISTVIAEDALRERKLKKLSETDNMTRLYNRNKYDSMLEKYYPDVESIGVVFWDVNGLKKVNDTMGHEYGDILISNIATVVSEYMGDDCRAYRIGGDEFVVIFEDATEDVLKEYIDKCQNAIKIRNNASKVRLSAACGYALGAGKDIVRIVSKADANMYENKQKQKQQES